MASGYMDFVAGSALTAAQVEEYCELQSVMTFASAAARTTALALVLREGLVTYLSDLNVLQIYTGSAWSTLGVGHGALTSWTPAVVQSGSATVTNNHSTYTRSGRQVTGQFYVTATGAGSPAAEYQITITLPVAAESAFGVVGTAYLRDASTGFNYGPASLKLLTATTVGFVLTPSATYTDTSAYLGATGALFTAALAVNDVLQGTFSFEAAADA